MASVGGYGQLLWSLLAGTDGFVNQVRPPFWRARTHTQVQEVAFWSWSTLCGDAGMMAPPCVMCGPKTTTDLKALHLGACPPSFSVSYVAVYDGFRFVYEHPTATT